MKGYLEYLELYGYFARSGEPKISQEAYVAADAEWKCAGRAPPAAHGGGARSARGAEGALI